MPKKIMNKEMKCERQPYRARLPPVYPYENCKLLLSTAVKSFL